MSINDNDIFFMDFGVEANNTKNSNSFYAILKSATSDPTIGGYVLESNQWLLVCDANDTQQCKVGDGLTIDNDNYEILKIELDGTGLSRLVLEKLNGSETNLQSEAIEFNDRLGRKNH